MKIFITVGTTLFDELIRNVDSVAEELEGFNFTFQISKGKYKPKNGTYFDFVQNIDEYYNDADLVITHSGAGSIYRLLELNKKIIVVPNIDRVDKHQTDISTYMSENNHVLLLSDFKYTKDVILDAEFFLPKVFIKKHFFLKDEIVDFIKEQV
ncbi:PssE/Cps14G family polysaccharide biosynthesis glycosyltransferase [Aliivibrio fischeri]|uniref:Glycosyltransferase domain-containing protein n=1 Tax=Aliivibrio fischeri SR5 TaxID=1088719 RepID=A0AAV3EX94_ALIFS|nr:PssE/Cps14G family polysaccharide biosynthesis glycosyltransferase [Aliivibrio fischeri]EHN71539.1 glycosyltransferase domain-containing protein [Aliivibrio fischeri SR5]